MRSLFFLFIFLFAFQTVFAQTSPDRWKADFEILKKAIHDKHPEVYAKHSQAAFDQDFRDLAGRLDGKSDLQVALAVQAILAKAQDSQTKLELKPFLLKENPIPFGLGWYADGIYISGTVSKFERAVGKKVVKINGVKTMDALQKLSMFTPMENEYAVRTEVLNWLRFPVAFRMAGVSQTDTLDLVVENQAGKQENVRMFPIDVTKRFDMMPVAIQQDKRDIRWQPAYGMFSLQYLEHDSIMYVQYNRCLSYEMALAAGADSMSARNFPPFQPLADSVLHFVRLHPNARLFLDLRFNSGGDPADGTSLAQRLSTIPSVNQQKKLFVAFNMYSAGAALDVASQFRRLTHATLIGDPPAVSPNHFAGINKFTLPNSRIEVSLGANFLQMTRENTNVLKPDVLIEMEFSAFKAGKDPVLDYVRNGQGKK